MKENTADNINSLEATKTHIWRALDLLKGFVESRDYHFVLFLLTLQRNGILKNIVASDHYHLKEQLRFALRKFEGENADELREIFYSYDRTLTQVNDAIVYELIRFFGSLDQQVLEQNFAEIFDEILYRLSKWQGRESGESMLPLEICRFAIALADLQPYSKVYNPFAGVASFGVLIQNENLYLAQEINFTTWAIGFMRLMAFDKEAQSFYKLEDSINKWGMLLPAPEGTPEDEEYYGIVTHDVVIANPPFGIRLSNSYEGKFGAIRNYEHFLIEKGLEVLKQNGKLIAVISSGILYRSGAEQNLRKYLVENDLLEMVISIPGGLLMNTGTPISILVINKAKQKKGVVHFIDAKSFVETTSSRESMLNDFALNSFIKSSKESDFSKIVTNDVIEQFDFNLNVPRYFQKIYQGVRLEELGSLVRGQRISDGEKGKFIRIRDLKDDALDYQLPLNNIEDTDIARHAQKITESCLLLASRWKTLKPTYFDYTGVSIFIPSDIFAFKINHTKCDLDYLINELHSTYVIEQLDSYRTGSVIPTILKKDLMSIVISLPDLLEQSSSLEMQKAKVKEKLVVLAEEKKRELALFNKIHGLEAEIIEQNSYLRHTLAGPSSNLKDSIVNLKKIFLEKIATANPGLLNLKISDNHLVSLGEYLDIIERDAKKIVSAVTSQLKVDTGLERKTLGPVEIISFLEKYSIEYNERSSIEFRIDFTFDKEVFIDQNGERIKTYILANEELLVDLFNNLIDNAVKHAFGGGQNNRIEIFIMKNEESDEQDEIQILVSNTGNPFPEDFTFTDFVRKGSKFGSNAGDGFGGWYINEIMKKLNGDFAIIDETGSEGLPGTDLATSFELTFPIIETE